MPSAVRLREDGRGASGARPSVEGRQPEPTASVAGCGPGWNGPGGAAKVGGMDRQTLRDWVHRFNASGPEGLRWRGRTEWRAIVSFVPSCSRTGAFNDRVGQAFQLIVKTAFD
jgi:hypothetical protein